jgi:hypothetical protein
MSFGRSISVTFLNAKNWQTPFGIMLLVFFITPRLTSAQALTTGSISGSVVDPQAGLLPGVSITATHQPTGTTYEAVTNGEGRFEIFSVRVGGPYRVVAALSGFREQTEAVETVGLGENRTIEFKLTLASERDGHGGGAEHRFNAGRNGGEHPVGNDREPAVYFAQHVRLRAHVALRQPQPGLRGRRTGH